MKSKIALLALLWPLWGLAQNIPKQAAAAVNPNAPAPAVVHQALGPTGASALVRERDDWKAVNATVGQYQRGHMDIVKWERAQQAGQAAPAPATPEGAR